MKNDATIGSIIQGMTEIASEVRRVVAQWVSDIEPEKIEQFLNLLHNLQQMNRSIGSLESELSDEALKTLDQFGTICVKAGWPPVDRMKAVIPLYIGHKAEEGESFEELIAALDSAMVSMFNDGLGEEMLDEWRRSPLLRKRLPILESILRSFSQNEFHVVVPTALSQLEGIVADGFGLKGHVNWSKMKKEHVPTLLSASDGVLSTHAVGLILSELLATFYRGDEICGVNRHAVLHGADTNYGNEIIALKAILYIDYFQSAFRFVGTVSGTAYHIPGCPVLRRSSNKRTVYITIGDAEALGRRPCRRCNPTFES